MAAVLITLLVNLKIKKFFIIAVLIETNLLLKTLIEESL